MPVQRQYALLNAIPRFTAKTKGALLGASGDYFLYFTRKTIAFSMQYWISAPTCSDRLRPLRDPAPKTMRISGFGPGWGWKGGSLPGRILASLFIFVHLHIGCSEQPLHVVSVLRIKGLPDAEGQGRLGTDLIHS